MTTGRRRRMAAGVPGWLLCLLLLSTGAGGAEVWYAKQDGVKITAEKSPLSKVVATLRLGDQVQVLEKSGRHYRIKTAGGKTGWVFKFKLSESKGSAKESGDLLAGLTGESRIAAREARAGGSIRGLKEIPERYATNKQIDPAHKDAVERMERRTIARDELLEFQRQGRVGEFGGG